MNAQAQNIAENAERIDTLLMSDFDRHLLRRELRKDATEQVLELAKASTSPHAVLIEALIKLEPDLEVVLRELNAIDFRIQYGDENHMHIENAEEAIHKLHDLFEGDWQ